MKKKNKDIIMQNKVFLWIALITGLILMLPFLAMQFNWKVPDPGNSISDEVNWSLFDFVIMGILISGTGSVFVWLARKTRVTANRILIGALIFITFLLICAELAVGIIGTPFAGS